MRAKINENRQKDTFLHPAVGMWEGWDGGYFESLFNFSRNIR
jgi:hypothetical protein